MYNVPSILHLSLFSAKKNFSLLFCLLFILKFGQSKEVSTFEDIRTLRSFIEYDEYTERFVFNFSGENRKKTADIFNKYESDPILKRKDVEIKTNQQIDAYISNPFIGKFLWEFKESGVALLSGDAVDIDATTSVSNAGISITTIADGLAKFYVKRVKAELNVAFFSKFQKALQKEEELRLLFPATTMELSNIGDRIYQYELYIKSLREKFFFDLNNLDKQISILLRDGYLKMDPVVRLIATDALSISNQIRLDSMSPPDLIYYLSSEEAAIQDSTRTELSDVQSTFKLLNIFSEGLLLNDTTKYWIKPEEFIEFIKDPIHLDLFLGLMFQKSKKLSFGSKTLEKFTEELLTNGQTIDIDNIDQTKLQELETNFLTILNKLVTEGSKAIQAKKAFEIKKSKGDSIQYSDYYNFIQPSLSTLQLTIGFYKIINPKFSKKDIEKISKPIEVTLNVNEAILAVTQQKYSISISHLSNLLELLDLDKNNIAKKFLDYGNFMAAVVEAEDSDDVADAIEAIALPVGSSLNKKLHGFSIEVNGYTGLKYGREQINDPSVSAGDVYGVFAPLGLTLSLGLGKGGSISAYGSIIDIGALTSFRFRDDTTKNLPEFEFSNIYAPGFYAIYGFPNIPLSIGFGFQDGPQLREINSSTIPIIVDSKTEWNIFIGVDIPLFKILNSGKI